MMLLGIVTEKMNIELLAECLACGNFSVNAIYYVSKCAWGNMQKQCSWLWDSLPTHCFPCQSTSFLVC